MEINVSPEAENQLRAMAAQNGLRLPDYAGSLLEEKLQEQAGRVGINGAVPAEEQDDDVDPEALQKAIARLLNRTPEEKEEARVRLLQRSRRARPLPAGKTFVDVVCGQWPGDETEEQIFEALRKLS